MKQIITTFRYSHFWQGLLISFILTAIFLNNFLLNLSSPMYLPEGIFSRLGLTHGDEPHVLITILHYIRVFTTGNFNQFLNMPIFFGFEKSLLFSEPFLFQAILTTPFYFITKNIVTSFHLVAYITLALSFFSTILLAYFLTKKVLPAVLAAIIFVFNPFIFASFPEHITYYSLMWIPLIFLSFEKFLKEGKSRYCFFFFFFLTINLISVLSYNVMLMMILPIYILVRIIQTKIPVVNFFNKATILGVLLFFITGLGLAGLYFSYYSKEPIGRGLDETSYYSATFTDFFIASANNLIYGNSRQFIYSLFPNAVFIGSELELQERNLFAGIIPLILLMISFKILPRTNIRGFYLLSLAIILIAIVLSFGPTIYISSNISFTGLYYFIYKINPLLHFLRVASRFSIFYFLFLGLICALVLNFITKNLSKQARLIISALIIVLVIFEYWNKPWDFMKIPQDSQTFYEKINKSADIKVLLELPIGNLYNKITLSKNPFIDTHYMLYAALLHNKKLLNGYSSYIPPQYTRRVEYLTINFPNPAKLEKLKKWGVEAIILHKEGFVNPSEYGRIYSSLNSLGVPNTFSTENISLFDLTKWGE